MIRGADPDEAAMDAARRHRAMLAAYGTALTLHSATASWQIAAGAAALALGAGAVVPPTLRHGTIEP